LLGYSIRVRAPGFFDLADRLTRSDDADEQKLLKEELARMTFGE
jgi:hypothetical protein